MKKVVRREPKLRFPEFQGDWNAHKTNELFDRIINGVDVRQDKFYQEIGIRSHGKGVFHKTPVSGKSLGNKRVFWIKKNVFILNIVFAWEQAVAKTTENEIGLIASHRFPMFEPKKGLTDLDYFLGFFLTKKGKHLLGLASPGGAGRNKTLGQKVFDELNVVHPSLPEQQKIASFLSVVEQKICQLTRKKELLEQYKKGVMQKIFSREIRFHDKNGKDYPGWDDKRLEEIASFTKGKGISKNDATSDGQIECIRYGELYTLYSEIISDVRSATNVDSSQLVFSKKNDVIIPSSGETHVDLATASCVDKDGVALGGDINIIRTKQNGIFLAYYLNNAKKHEIAGLAQGSSVVHLYSTHLKSLKLSLPNVEEQKKIASFLSNIDKKIQSVQTQLAQTRTFKKGLLQQLFV